MPFIGLIKRHISFDFLVEYSYLYFEKKWLDNAYFLDEKVIYDKRTFSHFDNTFPHLKIYAKAFSSSNSSLMQIL